MPRTQTKNTSWPCRCTAGKNKCIKIFFPFTWTSILILHKDFTTWVQCHDFPSSTTFCHRLLPSFIRACFPRCANFTHKSKMPTPPTNKKQKIEASWTWSTWNGWEQSISKQSSYWTIVLNCVIIVWKILIDSIWTLNCNWTLSPTHFWWPQPFHWEIVPWRHGKEY